jgi:hypothetical protein
MKRLSYKLLFTLLPMIMGVTYATTDSSTINLQVVYAPYVKIIGTSLGKKVIDVGDIRGNNVVNIGVLGLESSLTGGCSLAFSSLYGFSLKHSQGNQRLTDYQLEYMANTITSNVTLVIPCNTAKTSIDFKATSKVKKNPRPGFYSDTVTLTVTSP